LKFNAAERTKRQSKVNEKIAKKMQTTTTTQQMKGQTKRKKSNQCDVCIKKAQNRHSAHREMCREQQQSAK